MSDQKHPNQKELSEHTGQIVDVANAPLELSKGDLKLRSELLEAESRTEIKESVSGPELWPKPEELKSNPQSKLEEQQLNPELKKVELRPEVKKTEQSSPPWPEESESRTEIKEPVSGPGLWPKPEELKSNPQPKLLNPEIKEVELRQEVESRPKLKKAEQSSQPGPEESESRTDIKESVCGPELWPKPEKLKLNQQPKVEEQQSNSEQNEVELRQEMKEIELRAELTNAEQSSQLEPELGPEMPKLIPELGTEQPNLDQEPGAEQPGPDKSEQLQLEPEHPYLGPEKPQPGGYKSEPGPEQLHSELKKPQLGPEKPQPDPENPKPEKPQQGLEKPQPDPEKPEKPLPHPETLEPEKPQPEPERPQPEPDQANLWPWVAAGVLLFAIFVGAVIKPFQGTQNLDSKSATRIFQDKFKSLQNDFPGQSQHVWLRSGKMLTNHLNKSDPGEPVTIILTAAQDAKRTLLCLGSGLAESYAIAHNSSWLVIHGPSEAQYDDSTAKLHIDETLSRAFESTHRAAVLSHLETLPAGALLILYKYCDHENAAYKNVALVFTVLLEDPSLDIDTPLPDLEEKVRDFLWQQFITSDSVRSHQEMDSDKLGGVWSRISHLVLPVLPVESIEFGNCPFDYKGS